MIARCISLSWYFNWPGNSIYYDSFFPTISISGTVEFILCNRITSQTILQQELKAYK